jgi:hypothetical protein
MHVSRRLAGWVALFAALVLGCGKKAPVSRPGGPSEPGAWALTEAEQRRFVTAFEAAIRSRKALALDELFDIDAVYARARARIPGAPPARSSVKEALAKQGKVSGYALHVLHQTAQGGRYKFLRFRTRDGQCWALYRILFPEGGPAYEELLLTRSDDGFARIADVLFHRRGELLSQAFERSERVLLLTHKPDDQQTDAEKELARDLPLVLPLLTAHNEGKHSAVLRHYAKLPAHLKKDRACLLLRLEAAEKVGAARLNEAIEDVRKYYPDDPCLTMRAIDYYAGKKQFGRALAALDRFELVLGDDAALHAWRADLHFAAGELGRAREYAELAVRREADLRGPYDLLLDVSLKEKRFDDTVRWLDELAARFGDESEDIAERPLAAEFVESPQYKQWAARKKKR